MTAHDEVLAILTDIERLNRRLWEIHVEHAEKQRQTPQTRTLSTFALREPLKAIPLHGPGAPCCDAYGERFLTHDGSAPQTPTGLPHCEDEPPSSPCAELTRIAQEMGEYDNPPRAA